MFCRQGGYLWMTSSHVFSECGPHFSNFPGKGSQHLAVGKRVRSGQLQTRNNLARLALGYLDDLPLEGLFSPLMDDNC